MNDLRKAAEMALKYFEDAHGLEDAEVAIKEALRQALADKPPVKSYCGGKPNYCTPEETRDNSSWVGLTKEDFYKKDDETVFVLGMKFAEARLKEKNGG